MARRAGTFVAVVGPSGAGKDSLIRHAMQAFRDDARMLFVRRVVTREADAGAEDHDTMSAGEFEAAEDVGAFAVTWRAHGLAYGIPADVLAHVQAGGIAVANCSRSALPDIRERFGEILIVNVTARPDVLAGRIAARGREPASKIAERVSREVEAFAHLAKVITIENNDSLERACEAFADCLTKQLTH